MSYKAIYTKLFHVDSESKDIAILEAERIRREIFRESGIKLTLHSVEEFPNFITTQNLKDIDSARDEEGATLGDAIADHKNQ